MTKEELIKLSRENLRTSKQGSLCECYDEAFIKGYELSEKRIAELEKEVELWKKASEDNSYKAFQLQEENKTLSMHIVELQNDKGELTDRSRELEKENAELKGLKDVATLIRANNDTVITLMQLNNNLVSKEQQLTKAKDIINELLMNGYDESTRAKALDFLYPDKE